MRGTVAKRLRKMAKGFTQVESNATEYKDEPHTVMINGWVSEDGEMVKKLVPIIRNTKVIVQGCLRFNYQNLKASFHKWKRCP